VNAQKVSLWVASRVGDAGLDPGWSGLNVMLNSLFRNNVKHYVIFVVFASYQVATDKSRKKAT